MRVDRMTAVGVASDATSGTRGDAVDRESPARLAVATDASAEQEFVAFVERSKATLQHVAYLLTGDRHRAEELVQQTYERVWRSWRRARDGDPLVYARTVLANLRIDTWRRTRREVLTGVDQDGFGDVDRRSGEHEARVHARDAVVRALMQLPVRQRRVVVLRHLLDLPESEVATELGMPVGTVKSTASRALARMRQIIELSEGDQS
ncbi:RNA polymerase sigma-70 factor (sigma-E family) [Sediminihabitans luteus]|uniref:RNA polymerase sigma-70 factor (Sigma-E family) n=1 Tax=Sediminihabitans luteus TaxID=1138585 RepID=A0A2M9CE62_9CELL|nr:SigE family RNA polymerase sigma factor [Sediminihabitans luteus]PJJ70214.1 RNA polymerase sigma-70 factor (sigma-E family) [Sediminihabitans luteus]